MIRNLILAIVLVLQVAAWLIVDPPWAEKEAQSRVIEAQSLGAVDTDQVAAFEFEDTTGQSIRLSKNTDGNWVIENLDGFPAKPDMVAEALAELDGFDRADFRTSKRFLHTDLEVDEEGGQRLKLFDASNKVVRDLLIGKRDIQGFQGTFVRPADEDHVFVVPSKKLGTIFTTLAPRWRDAVMMDFTDKTFQEAQNTLRNDCYKFSIESKFPIRGDDNKVIEPLRYQVIRTTFVRDSQKDEDGNDEIIWRVTEPADKTDIICNDLLVKGILGIMLNTRASKIIGPGDKPEYGFNEKDRMVLAQAWFRDENDNETVRTVEIGNMRGEALATGGSDAPKARYCRVTHPGDKLKQSFVFLCPPTQHKMYQREADMFEKK